MLVRDEFPGKRIVNALIDLPFALPTIVAGVVLLALYGKNSPLGIDITFTRAAVGMALLFVTLPFVVRSVQPVLLELDRSMEEAAASLGAEPADGLPPHRAADARAGDRLRRRAQLRARRRRVRLDRADLAATCRSRPKSARSTSSARSRTKTCRRAAAVSVVLLLARWSCWAR